MPTVLLTDGSTRNALAYARSLGMRGIDIVVGAEQRLSMTRFSKYATSSFTYPDPTANPDAFFAAIRRAVVANDVDIVLPLTEPSVDAILPRRDELDDVSIPFPAYETFKTCRNKSEAIRIAESHDVGVPETRRPNGLDDALRAAAQIGYPVVLKPRVGHGSRGTAIVTDDAEMNDEFPDLLNAHGSYLVQEFIPGHRSIVDVPMVLDDGEHVASMVSNRIRQFPENGPNCFGKGIADDTLREQAVEMMEAVGWHGVCLVEFKIDERSGEAKLMEINPRSWGSTYLGVVSGIDFPHLLYRITTGEDVRGTTVYRTDRKARYLLAADLLAPFTSSDRLSDTKRWIGDFFDPEVRYYVLNRSDPLPALARVADITSSALNPSAAKETLLRGI